MGESPPLLPFGTLPVDLISITGVDCRSGGRLPLPDRDCLATGRS